MLGVVLLVLVVLGGWYGLGRLKQLEFEIRRDIEERSRSVEPAPAVVSAPSGPPADPAPADQTLPDAASATASPLALQLLNLVAAEPGIVQTELYQRLADLPKKTLQAELLRLAREGSLRREKSGGSYRLFPR